MKTHFAKRTQNPPGSGSVILERSEGPVYLYPCIPAYLYFAKRTQT
jgi:hypothetical protein